MGSMSSSLRIIVTGLIAQYPLGGMTWHYLQYVLGLRRLGHDVYYVEDTEDFPYDPLRRRVLVDDCSYNVSYLAEVMARFGLARRWAYRLGPRRQWFGMPDRERDAVIRSAELLLNVSGMLDRPEAYRSVRRLAFIDTDPIFNQLKLRRGGNAHFRELVDAHDVHFSFGEALSSSPCVPPTGHRWRATRQPIVLEEWYPPTPRREVFTTIMTWSACHHPPVYDGQTFGQKEAELPAFLDLPQRVAPVQMEIALNPGKRRQVPRDALGAMGWRIVDPQRTCLDLESYRQYIESSRAEWSVAKNGYVRGRAGWFSERSACYLAAGRPVVVQDTGVAGILPVGEGILTFRTPDEAAAAIRAVEADYARHAGAARGIAEAYFDSDKILRRLVDEACEGTPPTARTEATAEARATQRAGVAAGTADAPTEPERYDGHLDL
jgi:hypothetical protein